MDGDEDMLKVDKKSLKIPRFHPSTFLQNLQAQVLPDVKAHYHLHRPQGFPVLLTTVVSLNTHTHTRARGLESCISIFARQLPNAAKLHTALFAGRKKNS